MNKDDELSAVQAANILGVAERTFYALAKKDGFSYCVTQNLRMYSKDEICKVKAIRDKRTAVSGVESPIELPSWTYNLPNKTRMSCKDIYKFFNYKSVDSFYNRISRLRFPKPVIFSMKATSNPRCRVAKVNYWTLGSLRDYQIEQNKVKK